MIIQKVIELSDASGKDVSRFSVNGVGEYNKSQTGAVAVAETVKELVEKEGLTLQQAVDRINEIKPEGKFVIASAEKGFFEDKRCKEAEVVTSKGTFTVYVNNQWTPKKFGNFMQGMNEKFNNVEEQKERLSEITVSGQKKVETLMKEFNEKFPYLQLCVFPKEMMDKSSKTPVDRTLTIAKVRSQETASSEIEISIHGKKLVKNLEAEFLGNYGLYVEVCYYDKDGHGFFTSGSYDEFTLASLNKEIESKGGVKDKWY